MVKQACHRGLPRRQNKGGARGCLPVFATWSQHNTLNLALVSEEEGHQPHRRRQSRPWQHPSEPGPAGSSVVGPAAISEVLWPMAMLQPAACQFQSPHSLASCFFLSNPCVSQHNYSERCSQNGLDVQFSFPNNSVGAEIRVREAERQEELQTSEKDENTSKLNFQQQQQQQNQILQSMLHLPKLVPSHGPYHGG